MSKGKAFPKKVFVRREIDGEAEYLLVEEKEFDVVEDGPSSTTYGVYELVETRKGHKIVELSVVGAK